MFYIHQSSCISAQQTFEQIDIDTIHESKEGRLLAIEPTYASFPPNVLRRMGKSVRMGVGAALPLLKNIKIDGIIIGTANGGKEDCVKFMNQIVDFNEGLLTPINFVQSTPNAVAAQIGLLTKNHGYNTTHIHLGLSFEYAMLDADMLLEEYADHSYLLGAVDDISDYNFIFDEKIGYHKAEAVTSQTLYDTDTPGSIAGEAATMFLVNKKEENAVAKVLAVGTLHHEDEVEVKKKMQEFIAKHLPTGDTIDILLTGENGDNRLKKYYTEIQSLIDDDAMIARYKHMSGEYPTAAAMGLWLTCDILQKQTLPHHMIKSSSKNSGYKNVLIYNTYKGIQHSFILVAAL